MKINLFVFCLTLSLAGCCEMQPVSETASAVARHYSGEAQKQDAAKYLFRYMPWHCHYDGNGIERYYDSVAAILDTLDDAGQ